MDDCLALKKNLETHAVLPLGRCLLMNFKKLEINCLPEVSKNEY